MGQLSITIGLAGACGLLGAVLAERLRLPSILLYLLFGLLLGPAGLDLVDVGRLHDVLPIAVPLAVAVILFEGGLSLDVRAIRGATRPLRNLVLVGGLISLAGGTLVGWAVGGLPLHAAVIFGSLMIVTGPTVIAPILRRVQLVPRVRALLHWESILIDPVGVIVAVLVAEYVVLRGEAGATPLLRTGMQLGAGLVLGVAVGVVTGFLLRRRWFASAARAEAANLLAVAAALGAYGLTESLVHEGGIVAVTVGGLTLSLFHVPALASVKVFKEQITTVLVSTLFVVLAASIDPRIALASGWRLWVTVALVALVVRPAGVLLSTRGSEMPLRERIYVSWIGPRGIIAAAVASLSAILLRRHGLAGGEALEVFVFATIAATVLFQGLSAGPVASLLGVRGIRPARVVLAGAHALARAVARGLASAGVPARLIASNEARCEEALQQGLDVVRGSLADTDRINQACEDAGTFVALTTYAELNILATLRARECLGVENVYRVQLPGGDGAPRIARGDPDDQVAFLAPIDVDPVADAVAAGKLEVRLHAVESGGPLGEIDLGPEVQVLFVVRGGRALVARPKLRAKAGDRLLVITPVG